MWATLLTLLVVGSIAGLLFGFAAFLVGMPFSLLAFALRQKSVVASMIALLMGVVLSLIAVTWWITAVCVWVMEVAKSNPDSASWPLWIGYLWVANTPSYTFWKVAASYRQEKEPLDEPARAINGLTETWLNFTSFFAQFPLILVPFIPAIHSGLRHLIPF